METVVGTLSPKEEKLMKVLDFAETENFVCTIPITNVHTYTTEDNLIMIRDNGQTSTMAMMLAEKELMLLELCNDYGFRT